jgi:hypothetical protein
MYGKKSAQKKADPTMKLSAAQGKARADANKPKLMVTKTLTKTMTPMKKKK